MAVVDVHQLGQIPGMNAPTLGLVAAAAVALVELEVAVLPKCFYFVPPKWMHRLRQWPEQKRKNPLGHYSSIAAGPAMVGKWSFQIVVVVGPGGHLLDQCGMNRRLQQHLQLYKIQWPPMAFGQFAFAAAVVAHSLQCPSLARWMPNLLCPTIVVENWGLNAAVVVVVDVDCCLEECHFDRVVAKWTPMNGNDVGHL